MMVVKMFAWLAGLALVLIFLVIISPDLLRGSVFNRETRSSGRRVYETYCLGCHGDQGLGDGAAAPFLNPRPRNFVSGDYKFFHFGEAPPFPADASLTMTIRNGIPGSSMPAFPLLAEQEIQDIIAYVKSLHQGGWQVPAPIQAAPQVVPIAGETAAEIYTHAGCHGCHQLDALGATGGLGPDLSHIGSRLSLEQIIESIVDPNAVLATACPAGPCPPGVMPQNLGQRFSREQLDTLAQFLATQQ